MSQSATFPGETSDSGIANKSCKYLKLLHFLVKYRSSPQKHPCSTCKRSPHWTGVIVKAITRCPPIGGNRAIFTDECSPKSPKHCLQCSEQWAIFTDRWKSRDFYRWKSPQIARPFPIPETVTSSFWNIQSSGRFSPIGGNRAIFTDEFPPTLPNHLPSQRLSHIPFAMFRAMGDFHRSVEIARFSPMSASPKSPNHCLQCSEQWAIFTDRWKSRDFYRWKSPQIARPFPIPETVTSFFEIFKAMGDFHRSVEIARFLPMNFPPHCQTICHPKDCHTFLLQCSEPWAIFTDRWKSRDFYRWVLPPKSPEHLPSQRPSRISFAMFSAMGDFHRSVEIARFLPMSVPPNRQNIPITKTITDVFCNVQSNGRFSPIGGNRDFYWWNSSNCQVISHPRDFLEMFKAMGRFSPIGWIARYLCRWISPPHIAKPFAIPKTVTHVFCNVQSDGQFSPIGGKRAIFTDEFSPQIAKQFAIPKTVTDFGLWVPKFHGQKKSHRNRDRFATESPATCQIWRDGWQPSLLGPGGWGRPTLPRGTSQFCVCTSSARCSDSFLEDRNLPK